jgi:Domain of unknown function (DUF4123)
MCESGSVASQLTQWHAVVDTAQDPALLPLVRATPGHQCLVSGDMAPELAATMPYVLRLRSGEALADAWRDHGSGRNWGILFETDRGADWMRLHFKKFLNAKLPDGTIALFRFYDPRVFRTFVRAAAPQEVAPWFDGIKRYSVESHAPGAFHDFRHENGQLFDGPHPVIPATA